MKKMKKLLPALGGLLIVLTIGLTWTSCEKESDDAIYVWAYDKNYTLCLYRDNILVKKYNKGQTENGDSYDYSVRDNGIIKYETNKRGSKISIYRDNKLVSTCQYDTSSYKSTILSYRNVFFAKKDTYVMGFAEHYETSDTCYEMVLWKNNKIIWKQLYTANHKFWRDWSGFGIAGSDVYWLVEELLGGNDKEYFLYKNGEIIKTYTSSLDMLYLMVLDEDIYIFGFYYHGGKVWRNDELIFENYEHDPMSIMGLDVIDGDWYLSGGLGNSRKGRVLKNGEVLYDFSIENDANYYYPITITGVSKYGSDIYCFGTYYPGKGDEPIIARGAIWKNGEKYLFYNPEEVRSIISVFKK